jgi:hypothetical protein
MIYDNDDQEAIVEATIKACKVGDLNTVENLINKISFEPPYNKKNKTAEDIFINACTSGQLEIVQFLERSKYSHAYININSIFNAALGESISAKQYEIISYLLNDSTLTIPEQSYYQTRSRLFSSASEDDVELFKALLNLKNTENNNSYILKSENILKEACSKQSYKIIQYVCNIPELKEYMNLHDWFEIAAIYSNQSLLNFFISELNIPKDEKIIQFLEEYDVPEVGKMFNARDLHEELKTYLNSNDILKNKPLKL